jgi:putative glutamine amidotransferase
MSKPLIGLTTTRTAKASKTPKFGANEQYAKAISNAGGIPILVPLNLSNDDLDDLIVHLDGILFTGGNDIDPCQYGNPPHKKVKGIDRDRDRIELQLVRKIIPTSKPFLGICRGFQVINVALGGTLFEDLADQFPGNIRHDNHSLPRYFLAHRVQLEPDSRISRILSTEQADVNSLHHQGVRNLAAELMPTGYAPDELIEAFELPGYTFGLAVQWHPEELQEDKDMRKLFVDFVNLCG